MRTKICTKCKETRVLSDFYKDKAHLDGHRTSCKYCDVARRIKFRNNNRQKHNKYKREYDKKRRNEDPLYKLRRATSRTITGAMRRMGFKKNSPTEKILGCDWITLKQHIESKFTKGMTWDNYGEWEIDHIIPCASANNESELIKLQHYLNLQPLWWKDNSFKRAKII